MKGESSNDGFSRFSGPHCVHWEGRGEDENLSRKGTESVSEGGREGRRCCDKPPNPFANRQSHIHPPLFHPPIQSMGVVSWGPMPGNDAVQPRTPWKGRRSVTTGTRAHGHMQQRRHPATCLRTGGRQQARGGKGGAHKQHTCRSRSPRSRVREGGIKPGLAL